jgi:predicted nucleic acid-binding Zn ribbon protein
MAPIFDYKCENGHVTKDHVIHHNEASAVIECPYEGCENDAVKVPTVFGRYAIEGNNSASTTPKKWKGY